jgi:hypothetical protein
MMCDGSINLILAHQFQTRTMSVKVKHLATMGIVMPSNLLPPLQTEHNDSLIRPDDRYCLPHRRASCRKNDTRPLQTETFRPSRMSIGYRVLRKRFAIALRRYCRSAMSDRCHWRIEIPDWTSYRETCSNNA